MVSISFIVSAASLLIFVTAATVYLRTQLSPGRAFTQSLPWIGSGHGRMSWLKAVLRSIVKSEDMVREGYGQFSKNDRLFVIPTLAAGPVVMLPSHQLHLLNRPEREVAAHETQFEIIQPRYTMARDKKLYESTIAAGFGIVWKNLTRPKDVDQFAAIVEEELAASFEECWGMSEEWSQCSVFEKFAHIIARTTNRTYFGLPLGRDKKLLERSCKYAEAVFGASAMISVFPAWIRHIMGPLIAMPAQHYLSSCREILIPFVELRLEQTREGKAAQTDILQLLIEDAQKNRPQDLNALHLTYSLLAINQSSIYSTAFGLTNCILDLFSSEKCVEFVDGLREECESVSAEFDGSLGSAQAVNRLFRLDSCIRESMRVSGFNTVALIREISAPHGLKLDGIGVIPKGVRIGAPIQSIHFDPRFYPSPLSFDAFRFSDPAGGNSPSQTENAHMERERKQQLTVHVSKEYIPWGYGKHACPGRWIAVQMMKLALAQIFLNYDIQPLPERPNNQPLLNVLLPPAKATIMIRRRSKRA